MNSEDIFDHVGRELGRIAGELEEELRDVISHLEEYGEDEAGNFTSDKLQAFYEELWEMGWDMPRDLRIMRDAAKAEALADREAKAKG